MARNARDRSRSLRYDALVKIDTNAPTPTAAADMVVKGKTELLQVLKTAEQHLKRSLAKRLESARFALYTVSKEKGGEIIESSLVPCQLLF